MNEYIRQTKDLKIAQAKKIFEENQYQVVILDHKEQVVPYLQSIIDAPASVSVGGSVSLFECGIIDYFRNDPSLTFFDRYEEGTNVKEVFKKALTCDYYLTSSNAITLEGELYNVDNNGNRVAAMSYGPEHVIVVCGENKIVSNRDEARNRLYTLAGPANSMRLKMDNPCVKLGHCIHCHSKQKLCNIETWIGYQKQPGRITLIIIKEDLGY